MRLYRFGSFEVNAAAGQLKRDGLRLNLQPKALACLVELIERPGELVTREFLRTRLWADNTFVDFENNLNNSIARIRAALCDDASHPRFIETIRGRGFRFVAVVAAEVTRTLVAVLPFEDLSPQPQEYFSHGIAEEVITALASLNPARLSVIGRTSAARMSKQSPQQISGALGVDYFVEGSIRRVENRVRVTARLNDARTLQQVWTGTYRREWRDVLALETELAEAVAAEIRIPYLSTGPAKVAGDAFEHYLRGRHFWSKFTVDGCRDAIHEYETALRADPRHAPSHAGIGHACVLIADNVVSGADSRALLVRAEQTADRALAIDPGLAPAHTARAMVLWRRDWNWRQARAAFEMAVKLSGFHAYDHMLYAWLLTALAEHNDALTQIREARRLEPLALPIIVNQGWLLYHARRFEEARTVLEDCLRLEPSFWLARIPLAYCLEHLGLAGEAARVIEESGPALAETPALKGSLGRALAMAGESKRARDLLRDPALQAYDRAMIKLGMGELDDAADLLDQSVTEGASRVSYLRVDAVFDPLRGSPAFAQLARRIGV